MSRWTVVAAIALLTCSACASPPPAEVFCAPGASKACTCDDGRDGAQVCDEEGAAYGGCLCGPLEDASSGADVASDVGVDADANLEVGADVGADIAVDLAGEDTGPVDVGPVACEPPLSVPLAYFGLPSATVSIQPDGGTGAYRFELTSDGSGAILDTVSGLHVLGSAVDAQDTVAVTDLGCIGSVSTTITVIEGFEMSPTQVQVPTGGGFSFDVSKGSGLFSYTFLANGSGATLDDQGTYVAGDFEGVDSIQVEDVGAGSVQNAGVVVTNDVVFAVLPFPTVLLQGQAAVVDTAGGSAYLNLSKGAEACVYMDALLLCDAPGTHELTFTDNYTLAVATVEVTVAAMLAYTPIRGGDHIEQHFFRTVGDLDGDDIPDAIFGSGPASVSANNGGAIYVYRGQADGLEPTPVQVIGNGGRNERFGSSYATGDFDGDGVKELVVGAWNTWGGAGDASGAVHLFAGVEGGFFEPEVAQTWLGFSPYGYFGYSTAACDFNGDGLDDLAVGAYTDEDQLATDVASQQGVVYVFLGGVLGLPDVPDMWVQGKKFENGDWVDGAEQRIGKAMATGDVNGDGLCDLAVSGEHPFTSGCDDGSVFVFFGTDGGGESLGGLEADPAIMVRGPSCKGQLVGEELAMGDVDGDQLADVIISHKGHITDEGVANGTKNHGTVRILLGSVVMEQIGEEPLSADELPHLAEGSSNDYEGYWVAAGDVNGDGIDDVLTGSVYQELVTLNTGTTRVFYGQDGQPPGSEPDLVWAGAKDADRFGIVSGVVGDLNGDGTSAVIMFASRDDSIAFDAGQVYWTTGTAESQPQPLDYPEEPAGHQFGVSVALIPWSATGTTVAVAAPMHNRPDMTKSGAVILYSLTDGQLSADPPVVIDDHPKSMNGTQFGFRVANGGDFNGDGVDDLALVSYTEHQPNNYPTDYECGPSCGAEAGSITCGTYLTNTGALYVYLGTGDGGFGELPAFVYYSPEKGDRIESVAAVGNVDGDPAGRSDLAIGSRFWDGPGTDAGGIRLIAGRAHEVAAGKIQVICEPSAAFQAAASKDYVGRSSTALGDLNGDGCDDFAFGEERHDGAGSDRGAVRIVLGSGGPGCPAAFQEIRLLPENDARYTGWEVAGGGDVDGDGVLDLAVGIPSNATGLKTGRVVIVMGAYLQELIDQGVSEASLYDPQGAEVVEVFGGADRALCGAAVALLAGYEADGRAALAMGCPYGNGSGAARSGGAAIYRYTPGAGFVDPPVVTVAGEMARFDSETGISLAFHPTDGGHIGVMGAAYGNSNGLDAGSAYVFFVEAP